MPKIPRIYEEGPGQHGRRAVAGDVGGGAGLQALGQATKQLGDISFQLFEQEMSSQVLASVGNAEREINTLRHEIEQEPDHHKRSDLYAAGSKKITDKYREPLRFPKYQGLFGERIEGTLERGRVHIAQGVRQSQLDAIQGNLITFVEGKVEAYGNEPNEDVRNDLRDQIFERLNDSVAGGSLSSARAAQLQSSAIERMRKHDSVMDYQAETDRIRNGRNEDGTPLDFGQQIEEALKLTGVKRDAVLKRLQAREETDKKLEDKARGLFYTSQYNKVIRGLLSGEALLDWLDSPGAAHLSRPEIDRFMEADDERRTGKSIEDDPLHVQDARSKIIDGEIDSYTALNDWSKNKHIKDSIQSLMTTMDNVKSDPDIRKIEKKSNDFLNAVKGFFVAKPIFFGPAVDPENEMAFFQYSQAFRAERDRRFKHEGAETYQERLKVLNDMTIKRSSSDDRKDDQDRPLYWGHEDWLKDYRNSGGAGGPTDSQRAKSAMELSQARGVPTMMPDPDTQPEDLPAGYEIKLMPDGSSELVFPRLQHEDGTLESISAWNIRRENTSP